MSHEAGDRSVHGEHDVRVARKLAEPLGPWVVHPELSFEVDLARGEAALLQELDRRLGRVARRDARWAVVQLHERDGIACNSCCQYACLKSGLDSATLE